MDWDQYFMSMAYLVAMKSKDPGARVGTVIVDDEHEILSTGFNGQPRGFNDAHPDRQEKPRKLDYMIHSELNACLSAARKSLSIKGARAYVTWCCCGPCALALTQSGVKEVVTHKENQPPESWADQVALGREIFSEGGVIYREWSGEIVKPGIFKGGTFYP